jgi:hypothetical protein
MYLVFNVFYFYSGVGQKDSGVGRAHLAPPCATPLRFVSRELQFRTIHTTIQPEYYVTIVNPAITMYINRNIGLMRFNVGSVRFRIPNRALPRNRNVPAKMRC